jgi:hypothetical protein
MISQAVGSDVYAITAGHPLAFIRQNMQCFLHGEVEDTISVGTDDASNCDTDVSVSILMANHH